MTTAIHPLAIADDVAPAKTCGFGLWPVTGTATAEADGSYRACGLTATHVAATISEANEAVYTYCCPRHARAAARLTDELVMTVAEWTAARR